MSEDKAAPQSENTEAKLCARHKVQIILEAGKVLQLAIKDLCELDNTAALKKLDQCMQAAVASVKVEL